MNSINECDVDVRRDLYSGIVLTGLLLSKALPVIDGFALQQTMQTPAACCICLGLPQALRLLHSDSH